ncbi:DUF2269 family protein [Allorhizobium taibaishanense]|uniref:Putative membrane protein n=1 Tax=Allorhizobium taibaishanense TaxID=887144 RepID=A0A1Q9A6I0_9HYPH|nr:DUF2269 family protein [Allorhizobium taibaishanense]MBB4008671.1 putative membrane protein [Allorhizobium taibaishanense]OLP50198.1 hypothetical protein BJF91_12780 [Allorhizobium taibaishanense]
MSEALLFVHVFAATMFLGNIVVTAVWKCIADRSDDLNLLRYSIKIVFVTDFIFTFGGAILLAITGSVMIVNYGFTAENSPWLYCGVGGFALSGLSWVVGLVPNQFRQRRLLNEASDFAAIAKPFRALARRWYVWGTMANVFAIAALFFMVTR